MKFGLDLLPDEDIETLVKRAVKIEELGFSNLFISDHYSARSVYITLTYIGLNTHSIILGPGVTNPYLIHPAMIAQNISSLNELFPARIVLGLGAGGRTTLSKLGSNRRKPYKTLSESIQLIRRLLSGDSVKEEGEIFCVERAKMSFHPAKKIPIYIGAQGDKMLQLAGSIADGVLINASYPRQISNSLNILANALNEAERSRREIEIGAIVPFSVDRDSKEAQRAVTPYVAAVIAGSSPTRIEEEGISKELHRQIIRAVESDNIPELYTLIDDDLVKTFSISGTPEECEAKVEELHRLDIDLLIASPPIGPDISDAIELFSDLAESIIE